MHIYHPQQNPYGLPSENVFCVADQNEKIVGDGFLIHTYHPYLFPERPTTIYLKIPESANGKDMLLGALLGRAQQIREENPEFVARVFTQLQPQERKLYDFFIESGFDKADALDTLEIYLPKVSFNLPNGYFIDKIPFTSPEDGMRFVQRMNAYRLDAFSMERLQRIMNSPNFCALYINQGGRIVGEIIFAGNGKVAKIEGLYVDINYRNYGLAKLLIATGMKTLMERGVTNFEGDIIRRSVLQCKLAASCGGKYLRTLCLFPGIDYN